MPIEELPRSASAICEPREIGSRSLRLSDRLATVRTLDILLEPGEALFIPIGWWHQVEALDFSVSMTYTNFLWPNQGYLEHPQRG